MPFLPCENIVFQNGLCGVQKGVFFLVRFYYKRKMKKWKKKTIPLRSSDVTCVAARTLSSRINEYGSGRIYTRGDKDIYKKTSFPPWYPTERGETS